MPSIMAFFKKLKKKLSGGGGEIVIDAHPFTFHKVHGINIQLSPGRQLARRTESHGNAICFGSRPVAVNEVIYLKVTETTKEWFGAGGFGFTSHDPASLNSAELPQCADSDLTNKPGYWAEDLPDKYAIRGTILSFHVDEQGDVMYAINGELKGIHLQGITTGVNIWPLLDVYGSTVAMEFKGTRIKYTCNVCKEQVKGTRWKCNECDDCNMCSTCYDANKGCTQHAYLRVDTSDGKSTMVAPRIVQADEMVFSLKPLTAELPIRDEADSDDQCRYFTLCTKALRSMDIPASFFDKKGDNCFCDTCMDSRGDRDVYDRGDPPMPYVLPKGWAKFGLKLHPRAESLDVLKKWHLAFHGTIQKNVKPILEHDDLLMPGDVGLEDDSISEREGHFNDDRKPEDFNTKQVFLSPSVKYAGDYYAAPFSLSIGGKTYMTRVALQLRIKPTTYKIGPETVLPAKKKSQRIDPHITNDKLEWFTRRRRVVQFTGLMIKVE